MNESVKFLKDSLSIYSPSVEEGEMSDFLLSYLKDYSDEAYIDDVGNVISVKGSDYPVILLTSHIDTVSGEIPIRIEDNKLYGRGAVDAKGSICTFVEAFRRYDGNGTIIFAGVVEEEKTSKGASFLKDKLLNEYNPDFIINGEPSGIDGITIGYRGVLSFNYYLEKEREHFGKNLGIGENVFNFINELKEEFPERERLFDSTTVEIRNLNIDAQKDPQTAELYCVVRMSPHTDYENVKEKIEKLKGNAKIDYTQEIDPCISNKRSKIVRSFLKILREFDIDPTFKKKTGTSDMNILIENCENIVTYGPGDSSLDHTNNEHIDLEEYKKSIKVVKNVIADLADN